MNGWRDEWVGEYGLVNGEGRETASDLLELTITK